MATPVLKPILVTGAAIAALVVLIIQQYGMQELRKERQGLQSQLEARNVAFAEMEKRSEKLRPRDESHMEELMALRNEVSRLHALEAQLGKSRAEAAVVESNRAQVAKATAQLEAQAQYENKIAVSTSASKAIAMQLRIMQVRKTLKNAFDPDGRLAPSLISKSHPDFDLSKVEFLYPDAGQLAKVTEEAPETIVARTQAIAAPDGTWSRVYTLADGSVHQKSTVSPSQVYEGKWALVEAK